MNLILTRRVSFMSPVMLATCLMVGIWDATEAKSAKLADWDDGSPALSALVDAASDEVPVPPESVPIDTHSDADALASKNETKVAWVNFAVAKEDEPNGYSYTWKEAMKVCEDKGMSLPTIEELGRMYCHADLRVHKYPSQWPQSDPGCVNSGISKTIKNLNKGFYWSSTKGKNNLARHQVFSDGFQDWSRRTDHVQVRCIKRF